MTEQANNGGAASQNEQGAQFSLQRIYVRDLSFEAPKSPEIFRQEWNPSVALDLNTKQKQLESDFYEVVLTLSVTVKTGEEVAFIAEVQQAGIFLIKGLEAAAMSHTLGAFCPNILFPYAREAGQPGDPRLLPGADAGSGELRCAVRPGNGAHAERRRGTRHRPLIRSDRAGSV